MRALILVISAVVLLGLAALVHAEDATRNMQSTQAIVVTEGGVPLVPCGLFGPSKRELMQRMIEHQRETGATLHRIEVEQARQTELLRQIAGHSAAAAQATRQAADASRELRSHLGTLDPRTLQKGAPNMGDIRSAPDVPPTATPDPRTLQRGPPNMGDIGTAPDIEVTGPILQGTSGRKYYAKARAGRASKPAARYTNYSFRN